MALDNARADVRDRSNEGEGDGVGFGLRAITLWALCGPGASFRK